MRVLILDDEPIEQLRLKSMVQQYGVTEIQLAATIAEARTGLIATPDLLIADVLLKSETALALVEEIKIRAIPTVFVTVSTDETYFSQLKNTSNWGYLVKPFNKLTLFSAINLVTKKSSDEAVTPQNYVFFRHRRKQQKVFLDDILWIESAGNYTMIVTKAEKIVIKQAMRHVLDLLGPRFVRIHKQYCVDVQKVTHITVRSLVLNGQDLPVSFICKKNLMDKLAEFNVSYELKETHPFLVN